MKNFTNFTKKELLNLGITPNFKDLKNAFNLKAFYSGKHYEIKEFDYELYVAGLLKKLGWNIQLNNVVFKKVFIKATPILINYPRLAPKVWIIAEKLFLSKRIDWTIYNIPNSAVELMNISKFTAIMAKEFKLDEYKTAIIFYLLVYAATAALNLKILKKLINKNTKKSVKTMA